MSEPGKPVPIQKLCCAILSMSSTLQHSIFSSEDVEAIMVSLKTLGFEVNSRLQAQIMIALARSKNEAKLMTIDTARHQGAIMDM